MDERMQEKIFSTICREAQDAILYADHEGIIRFWNRGAQQIFGYSAEQAVGQSLDLIIPERLRKRHNDGYLDVMATGETHYGDRLLSVPAVNNNGDPLFTDFSIIMIKDDDGTMLGVAAIMRDTTRQKQTEKELRQKIQSLS